MPLNPLQEARKADSSAPGLFNPAMAHANNAPEEPYRPWCVGAQVLASSSSAAAPEPPKPASVAPMPVLVETTRRSNRTALARKVEDIASQAPSVAPTRASSPVPQNEAAPSAPSSPAAPVRKSLASSIFWPTVKGPDSPQLVHKAEPIDYFTLQPRASQPAVAMAAAASQKPAHSDSTPKPTRAAAPIPIPVPVETSRRSNRRPPAAPSHKDVPPPPTTAMVPVAMPPTPPPSEPSPGLFMTPKPFETSRRSNRHARPLVPQPAEEAPKSNLTRRVDNADVQVDLSALPQPVNTSRWTNRIKPGARHLRRSSTVQHPGMPGLYYFVPEPGVSATAQAVVAGSSKRGEKGVWVRPEDHVEHFAVDESRPTTPNAVSREGSVVLSSSPVQKDGRLGKGKAVVGIPDRRESLEDGFSAGRALGLIKGDKAAAAGQLSAISDKTDKAGGAKIAQPGFITHSSSPSASSNLFVPKPSIAPIAIPDRRDSEETSNTERALLRAKARGETIRPKKIAIPAPDPGAFDHYPICASPTRDFSLPSHKTLKTEEQVAASAAKGKLLAPATPSAASKPAMTKEQARANLMRLLSPGGATTGIMLGGSSVSPAAAPHNVPSTTSGLPTPPTSKPPSRNFLIGRMGLPIALTSPSVVTPSPGITVASLPPRPTPRHPSPLVPTKPDQVSDEFVGMIWKYLGLEHEAVARMYDGEIAQTIEKSVFEVREDRRAALTEYVRRWVGENPDVDGGDRGGRGMW